MTTTVEPKASEPPAGGPPSLTHPDGEGGKPHSRRRVIIGATIVVVLFVVLLVVGIRPRPRRQAAHCVGRDRDRRAAGRERGEGDHRTEQPT